MATRNITTRIALDGEQKFKQQMSSVNGELRTLKSEMGLVEAQFKGQANSMDALTAKDKLLRQEIEQQEIKVKALEQALQDASQAYSETDRRTDSYRQQLNKAKTELVNMNRELEDTDKYLDEAKKSSDGCAKSIDEFGKKTEGSKGGLKDFIANLGTLKNAIVGGAIVTGIKEVGEAIFEIVDETEEYRKIMGTLEVSSQQAGYSAEQTAETYNRLYGVLGDTQTAATTVANLQAIGLGQEELMQLVDSTVGAWGRYGDSIPIDGLAEAINETISVGKATGNFCDVLSWAHESEDAFNEKLAACNDETERANLVLQMMAQEGLAEAGQSWMAVNEDIVKANEAQAKWDEQMGRLGEILSPAKNALISLGADGIGFVANVLGGVANLIQDLIDGFDETSEICDSTASALEEVADAAQKENEEVRLLNERLRETIESAEEASDVTLDLSDAQDTLTAALDEQTESGSLNLDATLDLINAGYAAALAIDEETGAITLSKEAYIQIAQAKLDDQIASIETQRQSVQNALAMKDEALMALDLGKSYLNATEARAALEGQEVSYSAQIAALEKLKGNLSSYSYAVERTARSISTVSQKAQTQAEKDLAKFNEVKSALDHEKAVDLLDEKEYYFRLAQYRDEYLTDESNLDDYRKVTEEIYKYDQGLAEEEQKLWGEQTDALVSELEDRVASVHAEQEAMSRDLAGYGDLFRIEDGQMSLETIQDQIDALNLYEETVSKLRERGISDSLMSEVLEMDLDEAVAYGEKLIKMSDDQWDEYNDLWEEKQKRAAEIAVNFYQDQLDALETEYNDKLGEALGELTDTAFSSGQNTVLGLIDGLAEEEPYLYAKAQEIADEMSRILGDEMSDGLSIPSNQEVAWSLNGNLKKPETGVTAADLQSATATAAARKAEEFVINLTAVLDGATVARTQYKYNKRENDLRGGSLVEVSG